MEKIYNHASKILLTALALFVFTASYAQNVSIRGSVRDASGQPLSGASVTVQGSAGGTVADAGGNYLLSVPPGRYVLVVSYVGFAQQTVEVVTGQGGVVQDVILSGARDLGAVTVIGSRSAARTRVETPVPVDVIPLAQVVNEIGQVDLN